MDPAVNSSPRYITTAFGQLRVWYHGQGPNLVALAGLTQAAATLAQNLADAVAGWRTIVVELPGIGGSTRVENATLEEIAKAVAAGLEFLQDEPLALCGFELSCVVACKLAEILLTPPEALFLIDAQSAEDWSRTGTVPPSLRPRPDGTHLNALWAFLRDRHLLNAADPVRPASTGERLPSPLELNEIHVAASKDSAAYEALWHLCVDALAAQAQVGDAVRLATFSELVGALGALRLSVATSTIPQTSPLPGSALWLDYAETDRGRIHLRRAGSAGRPVLVIPTAGGSAAQFALVVTALARDRCVFAVDYFGNGLSEKLNRKPTIADLADDMLALLDSMDIEEIDVWGSHTGAVVGLEMAIKRPDRIRRMVLEAPPFITEDERDDILKFYFPQISPDKWGSHIQTVWNWRRDTFLYWPWYRDEYGSARKLGLPKDDELHRYVVGILESGDTYDGAYRAAWSYATAERLPLLKVPSLICAGPNDMLANALTASDSLTDPKYVSIRQTPTTVWWPNAKPAEAAEAIDIYLGFLGC